MNQTFSLNRFGRLLRKYFVDNKGQLLADLGLLTVVLTVICLIFYSNNPTAVAHNRGIPFFFVGLAMWYVFIWQQIDALNHKERALTYLMQPASHLEKIVLIWLVSGVGFVVVYTSLFGLIDAIGVQYVNSREWPAGTPVLGFFYDFDGYIPRELCVFAALLHPVALVGLLLIRRYSLPAVAMLAFALFFVGVIVNSLILSSQIDAVEGFRTVPFDKFGVVSPTNTHEYRLVDLPEPLGSQIRYTVGILVIILLYATAYYRLKEREV